MRHCSEGAVAWTGRVDPPSRARRDDLERDQLQIDAHQVDVAASWINETLPCRNDVRRSPFLANASWAPTTDTSRRCSCPGSARREFPGDWRRSGSCRSAYATPPE